jgi:uncharacterized membrane protein
MALGATLLGHALQIHDGFYDPRALGWLLLAILCCAIVTLHLVPAAWLRWNTPAAVTGVLVAGIASNLLALAVQSPGMYLEVPDPHEHPVFLGLLATAALLLIAGASGWRVMRRWWFPLMLATFAALGIWLIAAAPDPRVDVVTVYQYAAKALRHHHDPYTMTFPNIYGSDQFYPPGTVVAGHVLIGFPYPPLSLLLGLPGLALGDVRYAELAALVGAAALIGFSRRGLIAPLAATLMLFTPRGLFVLEQAWTEPLTLLALAATIYTAINARRALPIMLGLLIATKQYAIIALPLAWLLTRPGHRLRDWLRLVIIAILVAAIITLPFVFWNVRGFVDAVLLLQFKERFRDDSLSVLAWMARDGVKLTPAILLAASGLALAGGLGLSLWRASRTAAGFAAAIAFTLLLVFACSKKAFCNYYFFTLGVMCAAIAAQESSWPDATEDAREADARGINLK